MIAYGNYKTGTLYFVETKEVNTIFESFQNPVEALKMMEGA